MVYRILRREEWEALERGGRFEGGAADRADGFVHLSTAGQLEGTAARHFAGEEGLVLLEAHPARLESPLRWELSRGGRLFPHLYGPLTRAAVTRHWPLPLGSDGRHVFPSEARPLATVYPRPIEDEVYHCGFASPKSYGAASYLIRSPGGNWLTDSPRFNATLVDRFAEWGGLRYVFLTHRDDVADAAEYARAFGAKRIIHEADADAAPGAEIVLRGTEPVEVEPGFVILPVPGHTRGHCVLIYREKFLFAGDHVDADPSTGRLEADPDFCWHDWEEQARSMARMAGYRFEWVLPGHGRRLKLPAERMQAEARALAERMSGLRA